MSLFTVFFNQTYNNETARHDVLTKLFHLFMTIRISAALLHNGKQALLYLDKCFENCVTLTTVNATYTLIVILHLNKKHIDARLCLNLACVFVRCYRIIVNNVLLYVTFQIFPA